MSYLQYRNIIKYLLIALILFSVLYFLPSIKMDTENIAKVILTVLIFLIIMDNFVLSEGMTVIAANDVLPNWFYTYKTPKEDIYDAYEEDYFKSGFEFNHDMPGYYLANNGQFSNTGIDYSKAPELINESEESYILHNFDDFPYPTNDIKNKAYH